MAAGRHGSYRDKGFRDRDSEFDSSRREFSYSKVDYDSYDRTRSRDHEYERARVGDRVTGDRSRVRQKDIKERDSINGGYRSSSRSNSGSSGGGSGDPRRSEFSVRSVDREPGELSSESGSDEAIDSGSRVKQNGHSKLENGTRSSLESKKRKYSPIVWDRDDKGVSNLSKSRMGPASGTLPPPPPLPNSFRQSPNAIPNGGVRISPEKDSHTQSSEVSLTEVPPADHGSLVSAATISPVDLSSSPFQDRQRALEAEQLDDEDYIPARHISASRWAGEANSPADEGEIFDNEEIPKRRKTVPVSESRSKSVTPELGELKREGSERTRARSSESDGVQRVRSSSRDDYPADDDDRNEYMEIDEERHQNSANISLSDTASEGEEDSPDPHEPAGLPQRSVNMLKGCRSVDEFERLNKIDEGTYGVVFRAKDKKTGEIVALKKVKMEKEREVILTASSW